MSQTAWNAVDDYFAGVLLPADPVLEASLEANAAAGLPPIDVSPLQGQMLNLFVRMTGARRILEIGTLGAYSTICMARALPEGGHVVTLEVDPRHAAAARANIERAGLSARIDVRLGPAAQTLEAMAAAGEGPFDLVFIDADKPSNPVYLDGALQLTRPGSVIICDNVVRGGAVADPASHDPNVAGVRAFMDKVAAHPRLTATAIQTVGAKGWDGFAIVVVG